mgnify:CR=1 FL=1
MEQIPVGNGSYSLITNEEGGVIDDTVVSHLNEEIGIVVNAACREKDKRHLERQLRIFKKKGKDVSLDWSTNSLIALQGCYLKISYFF